MHEYTVNIVDATDLEFVCVQMIDVVHIFQDQIVISAKLPFA